jgi:hypothetical protein
LKLPGFAVSALRRLWPGRFSPSEISVADRPLLSKTKYVVGLQCFKALWIHYNDKALLPPTDPSLAAIFEQGHEIGEWAKKLFPDGIDLSNRSGFAQPVSATRNALERGKPIFEAAFIYNGCFSRADILVPTGAGQWDIIEVKSSTAPDDVADVRAVDLRDVAFQRYVYEGAGLKIGNSFLLLVNKNYVRSGKVNPRSLFTRIAVTSEVNALLPAVHSKVEEMKNIIALPQCPDVKVSRHCTEPRECALWKHCWGFLPQPSVFDLRYANQKAWDLFARGVMRIEDVPADVDFTEAQLRQIASHRSGIPYINQAEIRQFLSGLSYPLYFLDFETIHSAVPLFDCSSPYMQIPFQFSLHIVRDKRSASEHHSFLADGKDDPRPRLLSELRRLLGDHGSIVGYNTNFELTRLTECARFFPEYGSWVDSIDGRFVDLLKVFQRMSYYRPSQNGRASLKDVLPALTSTSYEALQISDGDLASREFMRIAFSRVSRRERRRVRKALEEYCAQDTRGLIEILQALERLTLGLDPLGCSFG